ncbi:MAG: YaeQ family protein, partial [Bdellovibrionota bacterium]
MSVGTSLYRFQINLSDIDRGHYDQLDFRMAMHPSETFN